MEPEISYDPKQDVSEHYPTLPTPEEVIIPMIEHIVLFQWKPEATPEQIESALTELKALQTKIPNVLALSVGKNFSERSQGFTHGLVVRFPDREALEVYGPHKAHQHVVQTFINPIRLDILAVDYEF